MVQALRGRRGNRRRATAPHQANGVGRRRAGSLRDQHAAFTHLVERSQHLAFGQAVSVLRDVEEAKDATQDAFTTAWLRLRQLRDASAFEAWLRAIVATECNRRLRRRTREVPLFELATSAEPNTREVEYQSLVASAITYLPDGERHVTVLFYVMGHTQDEIARLLRLKPGTVGKRRHSARLRIRRWLPPSVRGEFVRVAPTRTFVEKVRLGIFDEYVGEYRFARRPDVIVSITREGDSLISESRGQRHVLVSLDDESLLTSHYDGEGRFGRNHRGEVTHFAYYEFGKRLGVAWKADGNTRIPVAASGPGG
ncbi:MAG: RNA polymerase sigma factor [Gemmatimonadaceae bacterium]